MATRESSFSLLSRSAIDKLRAELLQHGVSMPQTDQGSFDGPHGIKVTYAYDESKQSLYVKLDASIFIVNQAWNSIVDGVHYAAA